MRKSIRKNLLDTRFSDNLQYLNTTLVVFFAYVVALAVTFLTGQVNATNKTQILIVAIITIAVSFVCFLLMSRFRRRMRDVLNEIREL